MNSISSLKKSENKLVISNNSNKSNRGISADVNKKTPKGLAQLTFNKLVAQSNKNSDMTNRNINYFNNNSYQKSTDKVRSESPYKKNDTRAMFLIPPQTKPFKKTLILDLDETLIHSSFQPFEGGSDIILKVNLIF
jgi:TFIIF-interacting CTD phosphatase-like protein